MTLKELIPNKVSCGEIPSLPQISLKWLKKKESYFSNSLIFKYTRRGSNPGHPD